MPLLPKCGPGKLWRTDNWEGGLADTNKNEYFFGAPVAYRVGY